MNIKNKSWIYKPLHTLWIEVNRIPVQIAGFFREKKLFLNDNYEKLLKYRDKHKGKRCFLVANGPSLTVEDLNLIKNEYTFGCNKIYYLFNQTDWRPTYYCILDRDYIARYQDEIFSHLDMPIFTNDYIAERIKPANKRNVIYSQQIYYKRFKAWPNLMSYTYATKQGTIMSYVMAVALYMGFSEIYVLGMDNTGTIAGNHFEGYKEDRELEENINRRMKENKWGNDHWKNETEIEMMEFRKYAEKHKIKIYNATRGGKLEIFPRINLNDCFTSVEE